MTPFRRRPEPPKPQREAVEITLAQMKTIERVILRARAMSRIRGPFDRSRTSRNAHFVTGDLIAELYRRAGAASVVEQDPDRARIPLFTHEFFQLEDAVRDIEDNLDARDAALATSGRELLYGLHALVGRARAIRDMGGTPAFEPANQLPEGQR